MVLPFIIDGSAVVIPNVYDTLRVADSLPAPAPAGRSMLVIGEAEEGIPGNLLDLKLNYFTDYPSVLNYFKSGPVVDSARMAFTRQPANIFGGQIQRLYVYKSNSSSRAEKLISTPSNFGKLVASRYGEPGNFIKSQIKNAVSEAKPTKTFSYLPSPAARALKVSVNGVVSSISLLAGATPADLQVALAAISGLACTGGGAIASIVGGTVDCSASASGDILTFTKTAGVGTFSTSVSVGNIVKINVGGTFAGASDENAGLYIVTAWSATSISLRQLKHIDAVSEIAVEAFDVAGVTAGAAADLLVWADLALSLTATTATGSGASLEIAGGLGALFAAGNIMAYSDLADIVDSNNAATGSIVATVPAANRLSLTLTNASWSSTPIAGDLVRIPRGSLIAGAGNANVGLFVVHSASAQTLVIESCYALSTIAVSSVSLGGSTSFLQRAIGFVSNEKGARRFNSTAERKVKLEASRVTDNETFPPTSIGGTIAFEIGYYDVAATAAIVSIDANRVMTITPTGTGLTALTVRLNKYATLQSLVEFLNTQAGIYARIPTPIYQSLPTSVLDMVSSLGILSSHAVSAYNGRIKKDYYDWKQFFIDAGSIVSFQEGAMVLKAGLPTAESSASFLSGASIGSTSNLSVQSALDAALKIDVRFVNTLFSRDAIHDVNDGLTDAASSYDIDSINAAVKAHVATAAGITVKRERFGMIAFHGSFEDAKTKCGEIGYEGCQMSFQMCRAQNSNGDLTWFGPHMLSVAVAAGRAQAPLGSSMLNKPFQVNAVKHIGNLSYYSDTLLEDFDPEDESKATEAMTAGLLVFKAITGAGVRMIGADCTTRSKYNDPKGWFYERANVIFSSMEVRSTVRSTLYNYIGDRGSDTPLAVVQTALTNVLNEYIRQGVIKKFEITKLENLGNGYRLGCSIYFVEALEFIEVDITAKRDLQAA